MIRVNGSSLSLEQVERIARFGEKVGVLDANIQKRMMRSHQWVVNAVTSGEKVVYGVNTGFGSLASKTIPAEETRKLSRNLILASVTGV